MRNKMKVNLRIILCYLVFVIGVALIIFSMNMIIHMFDLFAMKEILKLIGCCLPLLAKKLKLDPALMASPLITTIVDICSVWIFFQVATMVML